MEGRSSAGGSSRLHHLLHWGTKNLHPVHLHALGRTRKNPITETCYQTEEQPLCSARHCLHFFLIQRDNVGIYRVWVDRLVQEVWRLLEYRVLLHKQLLVELLLHLRVGDKGKKMTPIFFWKSSGYICRLTLITVCENPTEVIHILCNQQLMKRYYSFRRDLPSDDTNSFLFFLPEICSNVPHSFKEFMSKIPLTHPARIWPISILCGEREGRATARVWSWQKQEAAANS